MAKFRVSDKAKEARGFELMPEGEQIICITKAEVKPAKRPQYISIEAENKDGVTIRNRWDVTNDTQEGIFWIFYNIGCGLETDEDGYADVDAMVGKFVNITVKHNTADAKEFVDQATGEVKKLPERTFANFGRINGTATGFEGSTPDPAADVADDYDFD